MAHNNTQYSEQNLQKKLDEKELEIMLLEITQAVNNNLPEEDLYKIYEFVLRANLFISFSTICF